MPKVLVQTSDRLHRVIDTGGVYYLSLCCALAGALPGALPRASAGAKGAVERGRAGPLTDKSGCPGRRSHRPADERKQA